MFGIDDWIAGFSDGTSLWLVALIAIFLGLRHAADPDHLAAVTTLIASGRERAGRRAARMGLAWGLGHGTTLFVFGLPIVVFNRYLPERLQQGAETVIGFVIVYLAVRLLYRWRAGFFHAHEHEHEGDRHAHLHAHELSAGHAHEHRSRTTLGAFGIGLVHGMGGSAGVSVLLLATIESTTVERAGPPGVQRGRAGARHGQPGLRTLVRGGRVEPDAVPVLALDSGAWIRSASQITNVWPSRRSSRAPSATTPEGQATNSR